MDATVLSYKEAMTVIPYAYQGGMKAAYLDGMPGIGKSELAKYIQAALGYKYRFMIKPGHHDVLDFNGLPVADHTTKTAKFYHFDCLLPDPELKGGLVMVWDESSDAVVAIQNLECQAALENGFHNYRFPEDTVHFFTGNRVADRSGANRVITKLGNRVAWYTLKPNVDEVFEYGVSQGWNPTVLAFLKLKGNEQLNPNDRAKDGRDPPTYFNSFDPSDPAQMVKPVFASSRSIEFVSRIMNYTDKNNPRISDGTLLPVLAGIVGTPWAMSFVPFRSEAMVMPDPEAILRGDKVAFPKKESVLWCLTLSLVSKGNKNSWKYIDRFLKQGPAEYRILCVRLVFDQCIARYAGDDFNKTLQEADIQQALKAK